MVLPQRDGMDGAYGARLRRAHESASSRRAFGQSRRSRPLPGAASSSISRSSRWWRRSGFALSSSWISPGTLLTAEHAVPRVLDLPEAEARTAITALGFRVRLDDERQSPDVPARARWCGRTRRPTWSCRRGTTVHAGPERRPGTGERAGRRRPGAALRREDLRGGRPQGRQGGRGEPAETRPASCWRPARPRATDGPAARRWT